MKRKINQIMKKIQQKVIRIPIIRYMPRTLKLRNILLLSLVVYGVVGAIINPEQYKNGVLLYMLLFVVLMLLNVFYPIKFKRYKKTGLIQFYQKHILINDNNLSLIKIEEILFYYYGSKGDLHPGAALGIGILGVQDGADNQVYIKTKDDKEYFFDILLETEANFILLKRRLLEYKKEGVKIKMERLPASKQH